MGYYGSTCLNEKCKGPAILWTCCNPMYVHCRRCEERIRFLNLLQAKMRKPCTFDPSKVEGSIGMFHCPECGEMVIAGMEHPDYSLLTDLPEDPGCAESTTKEI